jgi:hypothetical protein
MPEVACRISSGVPANRKTSSWPVARSNCGPISYRLSAIEPPARTLSSAAFASAIGASVRSAAADAAANMNLRTMDFLPAGIGGRIAACGKAGQCHIEAERLPTTERSGTPIGLADRPAAWSAHPRPWRKLTPKGGPPALPGRQQKFDIYGGRPPEKLATNRHAGDLIDG